MTTSITRSSNHSRTLTLVHIAMFAALMAIGANISSFLIVGGVPITLQTFFAVLAGILLGKRLGAAAMIVYAAIGLAGVPVFAKFSGGMDTLISPTFGFILSYYLYRFCSRLDCRKNAFKKRVYLRSSCSDSDQLRVRHQLDVCRL